MQPERTNENSWQNMYLGVYSGKQSHFPIFVDLNRLQDLISTESLITEGTPAIDQATIPHFRLLLENGTVVFILDGLDEVELHRRHRVIELITKARLQWPCCTFIVTSRNFAAESLAGRGFVWARMCTMSRSAVDELISKWANIISKETNGDKTYAEFCSEMGRVIAAEAVNAPFVNSPLVIAFLAATYLDCGTIPDNRAKLFSSVADWLLKSRSSIRESVSIDLGTTKKTLEAIAFAFTNGTVSTVSMKEEVVAVAARSTGYPAHTVEKVIEIEVAGANCIVESRGKLGFWHDSLRDYFAACWIIRLFRQSQQEMPTEMITVFRSPELREIGDMLIALLATDHDQGIVILLEKTIPHGPQSLDNIRRVVLQYRILNIAASQGYKFKGQAGKAIFKRASYYLNLREDDMREMGTMDRIEALRALGGFGKDTRLYGPPWRRARAIESPPDIQIGKFPVTVQEYGRFLKELKESSCRGYIIPLEWELQLDTPNAPVTGVDWQQAVRYCSWLTNAMSKDSALQKESLARLPTLNEWSAMIGSRSNKRWSGNFATKSFTIVGRPVGVFFEQAGIYGHEDLSDGVWEWIGPSVPTKSRRKQIMSSSIDIGVRTSYWRRVSGSTKSPVIGFRIVFEFKDNAEESDPDIGHLK